MGFLDALGLGGGTKEQKLKAKLMQKYGPPENRQKAIEQLAALGTDEAIRILLLRLTMRIEPGITDDEEKERVLELIAEAGPQAVPLLKAFLFERDEIAFAYRALSELVDEPELVAAVCDVLDKAAKEYARDPEKRIQLMRHLREHKHERVTPTVLPFLEDLAYDVKIAALEAIASQATAPQPGAAQSGAPQSGAPQTSDERAREPLINALVAAKEESNVRVQQAAAAALEATGFDVKGFKPKVEAALPPGYALDRDGHVKKR